MNKGSRLIILILMLTILIGVMSGCGKKEPEIDWDAIELDESEPETDPPVLYSDDELYEMAKEDKSAENAITQFFKAVSDGRYDRAVEWLNLPSGAIFDAGDMENSLLKNRDDYPVDTTIQDFSVSESRKTADGKIMDVSYYKDNDIKVKMQINTLLRDSDNRWLLDAEPFIIKNFKIIVPIDCPTYINGELLPRSMGTQDDKKLYNVYTIPALAKREIEIKVESNMQEDDVRLVTPEKNGEVKVLARLKDDTFNDVSAYLRKTLEDVVYSIEKKPNYKVLEAYLDADTTSRAAFESMYSQAVAKINDKVSYKDIIVKDILVLTRDECRVEAVDKIRMSIRIVYNRTETLVSGRTINADVEARTWVILTKVGDEWQIWSADTNMLKFY